MSSYYNVITLLALFYYKYTVHCVKGLNRSLGGDISTSNPSPIETSLVSHCASALQDITSQIPFSPFSLGLCELPEVINGRLKGSQI